MLSKSNLKSRSCTIRQSELMSIVFLPIVKFFCEFEYFLFSRQSVAGVMKSIGSIRAICLQNICLQFAHFYFIHSNAYDFAMIRLNGSWKVVEKSTIFSLSRDSALYPFSSAAHLMQCIALSRCTHVHIHNDRLHPLLIDARNISINSSVVIAYMHIPWGYLSHYFYCVQSRVVKRLLDDWGHQYKQHKNGFPFSGAAIPHAFDRIRHCS